MDWKTLAPFQSEKIRNICSHMTEEEKKKSAQFGGVTGVFVAVFFAIPLSFGVIWAFKNKSIIAIFTSILWVLIGIPILLSRRRKGKELLCSTKYAQEQGYTIDKI